MLLPVSATRSAINASTGQPDAFGSFSCADTPGAGSDDYIVTAHYGSWSAAGAATDNVTVVNVTTTTAATPASGSTGTAIPATAIPATLSGS